MRRWTYDGAKPYSLRMVSINCFKGTARAIHRSSMVALCCSQSEDDTGRARGPWAGRHLEFLLHGNS